MTVVYICTAAMRLCSNLWEDHGTPSLWPTSQQQPFLHCFGFPNVCIFYCSTVFLLFFYSFFFWFFSISCLSTCILQVARVGVSEARRHELLEESGPKCQSLWVWAWCVFNIFQCWYFLNGLVHVHALLSIAFWLAYVCSQQCARYPVLKEANNAFWLQK